MRQYYFETDWNFIFRYFDLDRGAICCIRVMENSLYILLEHDNTSDVYDECDECTL